MQLVCLIRHGLAEYKPGRLYGWTPGVHLSAEGRDQVKRLAERLEPVKLNALYSSPLERCSETAEAILAGRRLKLETVREFGEVQYGSWQGKTYRSLVKTPLWRTVQLVPSQARFPGGESLLELQRRGVAAVGEPGQRVFYLQARKEDVLVSVVVEKQQVALLAMHIDQLLERIGVPDEDTAPDPDSLDLEEPLVPEFRVGAIGLAYEDERD